ncbi:MalY/PatB family protein [Streptomyces coffeae]|uniref:cysteine-S-conjugate beta-lyase n=1 Tax=Streptomyces coffeae TaxID=621382 RepID=A0ABS1NEJ0_9ACTN|nr:aminotransferase class I/II-fold pyridoxal phosphate-dependent enzyme [Streptomyces coffeae]MBL1098305.1 aminotransferase class I/II-fold pyridoxal phosphate-dependent enzyme [Streptomyces coffeae]
MRLDAFDLATLSRRDGEKWSSAPEGVLPAWVADMDFPISPAVRRALLHRIDTDLGYPAWYDESEGGPLGEVFARRMRQRFAFEADPAHVRLFTDVNQAMQIALHLGTAPGDPVAVHTPACPPFLDVLTKLDRPPRTVPIRRAGGEWDPDIGRLVAELRGAADGGCRALLLVNPHNPTGRVLRRDELLALAEVVVERDLLVISDEVHAELTYDGSVHIPFASLSEEVAARTVTVTSGSKAFNLAGARCAVAHIGVKTLRDSVDAHRGLLFGQVGALGVEALKAAWSEGDEWLAGVREVLARNRLRVAEALPEGIGFVPPEATYLAWLDCRALGVGDDPSVFFQDQGKLMLFRGADFGPEGRGFARLNFATSPPVLEELLRRMRTAVERHRGGSAHRGGPDAWPI